MSQPNLPQLGENLGLEEGDKRKTYLDTKGYLTGGRGHNFNANPKPYVTKVGDTITAEQDDELFNEDMAEAMAQLDHYLPWWRNLDNDRMTAMIDLMFNMGAATLLTFHHFLDHVRNGMWDLAADDMIHSKWHDQVGKRRAGFLENVIRHGQYGAFKDFNPQ